MSLGRIEVDIDTQVTTLRVLADQGMQVPGDVPVVGFDDLPLALQTVPRLTTVKQDIASGARAMVDALGHSGTFNIATGVEISVGELAQNLIDQIDGRARIVLDENRLRPEKSEVERLSGGKMKVTLFPGSQLGPDLQVLSGLRAGAIEAQITTTSLLGSITSG